jgi:hypothetical protein
LEFPITASAVLALVAALAIAFFIYCPKEREAEKFAIEAITLTAGALSAYYIGQGLRETVVQRDESLKGGRIAVSCRFIERWNLPELADVKDTFREIIESGKAHDATFVEELQKEKEKRIVVVEVLNYFEEIALLARGSASNNQTGWEAGELKPVSFGSATIPNPYRPKHPQKPIFRTLVTKLEPVPFKFTRLQTFVSVGEVANRKASSIVLKGIPSLPVTESLSGG